MAKIRADYVFGTIDTALTTSSTTLSSPALSRLPAVASPDTATITLDDSVAGTYEIVYVTAHTSGATTATITRAQEGSTARSWASGATWLHGPTSADFASGGSAPSYALDQTTLHATYGDEFNGTSLDAKWTRTGTGAAAGNESFDGKAMTHTYTTTGLWRYTQPAPAGDFSVVMHMAQGNFSNGMVGPFIADSSGAGWTVNPYQGNHYGWSLSAWGYGSSVAASVSAQSAMSAVPYWYRIKKVGSTTTASLSMDGQDWFATWQLTVNNFTPAYIGFGNVNPTGWAGTVRVYRFNVE